MHLFATYNHKKKKKNILDGSFLNRKHKHTNAFCKGDGRCTFLTLYLYKTHYPEWNMDLSDWIGSIKKIKDSSWPATVTKLLPGSGMHTALAD